jgi:hypothetical protein
MANKYMKKMFAILSFQGNANQNGTDLSQNGYHQENKQQQMLVRKRNPYTLLGGMYINLTTMEISMKDPQITKNITTASSCYPTPGYVPKGIKVNMQ